MKSDVHALWAQTRAQNWKKMMIYQNKFDLQYIVLGFIFCSSQNKAKHILGSCTVIVHEPEKRQLDLRSPIEIVIEPEATDINIYKPE